MTTSKTRLGRVLGWLALLVGLGLLYALFVRLTGLGLSCPIHAVTGLLCPGCGVSRVCLRLLRLDLPGALRANAAVTLLLPLAAALGAVRVRRYVKTGRWITPRWEERTWQTMAVALLAFGVLRNLPWFSFLAPR